MPPTGPLKLEKTTIDEIESNRKRQVNYNVVSYLRQTLPPELREMDDKHLSKNVDEAMLSASKYGVNQQDALCRWSYIHVITNGAIGRDKKIGEFMTSNNTGSTPDEKVREIMTAMIYGLKAQA
jgi:hypothetical protein